LAEQPFDAYWKMLYEAPMYTVLVYLKGREITAAAAELRRRSQEASRRMKH